MDDIQEEGPAGVKAGRRKMTMCVGVKLGGRQWQDAQTWTCTEVCGVRQGLHPAAAKWLVLTTLTPISSATSCFSFSRYWEQFYSEYVPVCVGTIHICGLFESCLSSWPLGLCFIMIFTLYSSPDLRKICYRNCKDEQKEKLCLVPGPKWMA